MAINLVSPNNTPTGDSYKYWDDSDFTRFEAELMNEGVIMHSNGSALEVTEKGAGADMSVDVAAGICLVEYTKDGDTLKVYVENTTTENIAISSNTSGSTRYDIICVKIDTTLDADADADNVASIVSYEGTPGAGVPSTPSDYYKLAEVEVINGAVTIPDAKITDKRLQVTINCLLNTDVNDSQHSEGAWFLDTTGSTERGLFVYSNQASPGSGNPLVEFQADNATFNQYVLDVRHDGTASAINIVNSVGGNSERITHGGTDDAIAITSTSTGSAISIDQNAAATNGSLYIENTGNTSYGANIYTNIGATASQPLVQVKADNTAFDQACLRIDQDGVSNAIYAVSTNTNPSQPLVSLIMSNSGFDEPGIEITHAGNSYGISIDMTDSTTQECMKLDQSADDDRGYIYFAGTAGAGKSIDTNTTSGAVTHHLRFKINGTDFWIPGSTNAPT